MPPICPHCNHVSLHLTRHCVSPTCDLIACKMCGGYGTEDGRLWHIERTSV